jgi:hypothetical protein
MHRKICPKVKWREFVGRRRRDRAGERIAHEDCIAGGLVGALAESTRADEGGIKAASNQGHIEEGGPGHWGSKNGIGGVNVNK